MAAAGMSCDALVAAFAAGSLTPSEALQSVLAVVDAVDGRVGAFTALDVDGALAAAAAADHAWREGGDPARPLLGVPVAVKELVEVAGLPFTAGSAVRRGVVGCRDASVVRALRGAGAVVVGVTRTHEFAWGITTQHSQLGSTRNPWALDRVPGGSSGGSAAAVATGAVPLAVGTDTAGSVRIPAGFCGVVGYKPTHGAIPVEGVFPLAPSFDVVGFLGREVSCVARAAGVPLHDVGGGVRVGVPTVPAAVPLAPGPRHALASAIQACEQIGTVVEVRLPDPEEVMATFAPLQMREALGVHRASGYYPDRRADYGDDVGQRLDRAAAITDAEHDEARARRRLLRDVVDRRLAEVDVVISPLSAGTASTVVDPDHVEHLREVLPFRDVVLPCTAWQNVTGVPSCVVPGGVDQHGVPVGVQVTGRRDGDAVVLSMARALRDALRWRTTGGPAPGPAPGR